MLTPEQRSALVLAVARKTPLPVTPAQVALFLDDDLALEVTGATPRAVAEWIVDRALEHATPDFFIKSVTYLDNNRVNELVQLATELRTGQTPWRPTGTSTGVIDWRIDADPLVVLSGQPFLNREPFRQLLPRHGHDDETPACTVVQGSRGSGKSYLHEYCQQLAQTWTQPGSTTDSAPRSLLRIGVSEFPESATNMEVDVPALELASGLRPRGHPPRRYEGDERWAKNLAAWITSETPAGRLPAVAVLDGYGHPNVPPAIKIFIEDLVKTVHGDPEVAARLRVMLLDYDVGRLQAEQLPYESLVLGPLGTTEIRAWFERQFPGRPDFRYDDAVAEIEHQLNGRTDMKRLCLLVEQASKLFEALP